MSRQPTISTDSVAQDQIRAFVERILRMKEEANAINDDIREIYAEAKGNGFDKTVLGQVVSFVEKRQKDPATLAERGALFELYIAAIDGGDQDDEETGTVIATHVHEAVPHDPVTGELIEVSDEPQQASATSERPNLAEPADELDTAGDDQGEQKVTPEPAAADEATLTPVKAGQASQQGEGGGEDAPASLADTIRQDEPVDAVVGGTQPADDRFHSEPGNGQAGETPVVATRQAGEASSDASPVRRMTMTPLEPRTAGGLKGFGFTVKFDDAHEPVQPVKEGSTTIPHHGTVRA